MQQVHADNNRNESQIDFVFVDRSAYSSPDDFYSAAIRLLWAGWDSDANTDKYIANAIRLSRTIDELQKEIAECLSITPVADFTPNFDGIEVVFSFYDDWNVKEFVWYSDKQYWFMSWGTAA
ncbi:MAG: hypothetical protein K0U86_08425 [Planctomycetes bacterium]|nr:hypothetical protein [Planctomycetota bacterium]MCH9724914.1 hypothetical protein [Planctomycetota bacterium]MCH9776873.1 hypothetical protein [Planctomycetota bacterium]MCH9790366.1 hypothetical protein [Planctomycetota bacterium]MDF1745078.1 hypothetical protein [Gimesia sp.]